MDGASHVETELLIDGFERARQRFDEAATATARNLAFQCLFEAVAWLGAIRDRLDQEGRSPREELEAFWFVRNRMLHQGADALAQNLVSGGAMLGALVLGATPLGTGPVYDWRWRSASELGGDPRRDRGLHKYVLHLEGREVAVTLTTISELLAGLDT